MYVNVKQRCITLRYFPLKMDRLFFKSKPSNAALLTSHTILQFCSDSDFESKCLTDASEKLGKFATF